MTEINSFLHNIDYIWNCIIKPTDKDSSDQDRFMTALSEALSYLETLDINQIKNICAKYDVAEKISMLVDLKDYVYKSLKDEWENPIQ